MMLAGALKVAGRTSCAGCTRGLARHSQSPNPGLKSGCSPFLARILLRRLPADSGKMSLLTAEAGAGEEAGQPPSRLRGDHRLQSCSCRPAAHQPPGPGPSRLTEGQSPSLATPFSTQLGPEQKLKYLHQLQIPCS